MSEANPANNSPSAEVQYTSVPFRENNHWLAIAYKLRQQNCQLIKKVVELEQQLEENQRQFSSQQQQITNADLLTAQNQQELNLAQQQITRLLQELADSHQVVQQQQVLIDNHEKKLASMQVSITQLEQENVRLKGLYQQQAEQLLQSQQHFQELNTRLLRQQQQNLQLKAALKQLGGVPDSQQTDELENQGTSASSIEIKPWSSQTETATEADNNLSNSSPSAPGESAEPHKKPTSMAEIKLPNI